MSPITTHVLDLSSGCPAVGVAVRLSIQDGPRHVDLAAGVTDVDGRARDLLPGGTPLEAGTYRIHFETKKYFDSKQVECFFQWVDVDFAVDDPSGHYHVPLLLSPFGYSTYRGS